MRRRIPNRKFTLMVFFSILSTESLRNPVILSVSEGPLSEEIQFFRQGSVLTVPQNLIKITEQHRGCFLRTKLNLRCKPVGACIARPSERTSVRSLRTKKICTACRAGGDFPVPATCGDFAFDKVCSPVSVRLCSVCARVGVRAKRGLQDFLFPCIIRGSFSKES